MEKNSQKRKKVTILFLCLLLLIPQTAVFAASDNQSDYADSLYALGVFFGTENGYDLDRAPTRAESTAMLVRMLGAEEEAQQMKSSETPFTDVPDWASGYVAYAYENGLVAGISDTTFGSSLSTTAQMYTVFMLRALGYSEQGGDFAYSQALSFAQSVGLLNTSLVSDFTSKGFTRGDAVQLTYLTLRFPVKNSDLLLVEQLVGKGKLEQNAASVFLETVITDSSQNSQLSISQIAEKRESVVLLEGAVSGGISQGSGIILSADGLILTNYHVIEGMQSLSVTFNDGSIYEGTVYVEDYSEDLDLALISIDQNGLIPVTLGDSDQLTIGDTVVAIGSPYGLQNTVSEGIVSSIRDNELQITAAISSGSSGGALFNIYGELIGVTYAGVSAGQNLGFAIPINQLELLTERLHQPLAELYQQTSAVSAPKNLSLVQVSGNTLYLQWDAVDEADYYLLYYKTAADSNYTVLSNYGVPYRFYHQNLYSASLTSSKKDTTYYFVVTAVRDGVESEQSEMLRVAL